MASSGFTRYKKTAAVFLVPSAFLLLNVQPVMAQPHIPVYTQAGQTASQNIEDAIFSEIRFFQKDDKTCRQITHWILSASRKTNVDPLLLTAVMEAESGFKIERIGKDNRVGLMQLTQKTAKQTRQDIWVPKENVLAGAMLLADVATTNQQEKDDATEALKQILTAYFQKTAGDHEGNLMSPTILYQMEWVLDIYHSLRQNTGFELQNM